jgi:hypothetical protein
VYHDVKVDCIMKDAEAKNVSSGSKENGKSKTSSKVYSSFRPEIVVEIPTGISNQTLSYSLSSSLIDAYIVRILFMCVCV